MHLFDAQTEKVIKRPPLEPGLVTV
jgi:hypothetical protein